MAMVDNCIILKINSNMKNNIFLFMLILFVVACTPMDDKYKQFVDDGPIVYISKLNDEAVKVTGERNRINMSWPKQEDPRGKKAIVYWANKTEKFECEVNPALETSFFISPLNEGSYIFEVIITDNDGNSSIPISLAGYAYGSIYESYLMNRRVTSSSLPDAEDRKVTSAEVVDMTMVATDFKWLDRNKKEFVASIPATEMTGTLENCRSLSFMYRTLYSPEGGVDIFYAPWEYYTENTNPKDVSFDFNTKTVTFPIPDDGNWTAYEMNWTDKATGEAHSLRITEHETVIPYYNGREFTFEAVFSINNQQFLSATELVNTASYSDLDRTEWYAAPETDLDGNPLPDVNYGDNPGTATAATGTLIKNKLKSPYLSHLLPWNNSAGPTSATADGNNNPSAHFDESSMTYLSMVKGIGEDATSGVAHVNGGVIITEANEKPWFIIRLHPSQPQKFNYFRMRYRENGSNGSGLKPQGVTFFGSNDDSCITDESKWTKINPTVIVPPGSTAATTQPPAANMGTFAPGANIDSGNVMLPVISEYKYVKMQYDRWETGSNTMQIAEFWLGLYD
jgi:hypothetical protein